MTTTTCLQRNATQQHATQQQRIALQQQTTQCNALTMTTHCTTTQGNMKTIEFIDNKLYRTIKTDSGWIVYEKEHKEINLIPRFRIRRKGQQESESYLFNNNNGANQ